MIQKNFFVLPYRAGIKLVNPKLVSKTNLTLYRLQDLLDVEYCSYATDIDHKNRIMNDIAFETCGYNSMRDAIGRSMSDIADKESAQRVFAYQKYTMQTEQMNYIEDEVILKNGSFFQSLNIIKPLYNLENKIIGIYGFTILPEVHSVPQSLKKLSQLCLLNENKFYNDKLALFSELIKNRIYLSKREWECLEYLIRGYTMKTIAARMALSPRTIEFYILNLKQKFKANNKSDLLDIVINFISK